jgi:small subunit ribosomal protein S17
MRFVCYVHHSLLFIVDFLRYCSIIEYVALPQVPVNLRPSVRQRLLDLQTGCCRSSAALFPHGPLCNNNIHNIHSMSIRSSSLLRTFSRHSCVAQPSASFGSCKVVLSRMIFETPSIQNMTTIHPSSFPSLSCLHISSSSFSSYKRFLSSSSLSANNTSPSPSLSQANSDDGGALPSTSFSSFSLDLSNTAQQLSHYSEDVQSMTPQQLSDYSTIPGFLSLLSHSLPKDKESTPRNALVGRVVSDKMSKTVNVAVDRYRIVPKYRKRMKYTRKFMAHDEQEVGKEGDVVMIVPCQKLSKKKHFRVHSIVRAKGRL